MSPGIQVPPASHQLEPPTTLLHRHFQYPPAEWIILLDVCFKTDRKTLPSELRRNEWGCMSNRRQMKSTIPFDYMVSSEGVYCLINNRDGLLGASNCVETFLIKSRHSSIW